MVELSELVGRYEASTWGDDYLTQSFRLVLYGDGKAFRFMYYYKYTTNHGYDEEFWEGRYERSTHSTETKEVIRLSGTEYKWGWEDYFKETYFEEKTQGRTVRVHEQDDGHYGFSFGLVSDQAALKWTGDVTDHFIARFERSMRQDVEKHRERARVTK